MRISDWSSDVCSSDLKDDGGASSAYLQELLAAAADSDTPARARIGALPNAGHTAEPDESQHLHGLRADVHADHARPKDRGGHDRPVRPSAILPIPAPRHSSGPTLRTVEPVPPPSPPRTNQTTFRSG